MGLAAAGGAEAISTLPSLAEPQNLERSWQRLDAELRALDQLLPADAEPAVRDLLSTPDLPASLLRANQAPSGALAPAQATPAPPLECPAPSNCSRAAPPG